MTASDPTTLSTTAPASIADERGFAHCQRVRVRYAETDAMGIVYHANYVTFFEVGRVEYLRAAGIDYRSLEDAKMTGAVVEVGVRFHAPARFDDELSVCTRCASMERVRFRMEYEIWRESERTLIVSGHIEHALLSHATLRPVRIPEEVRSGVERFEAAQARAREAIPAARPPAEAAAPNAGGNGRRA